MTFAMILFSALGSGWSIVAFLPLFASKRWRPFARSLLLWLIITAIAVFSIKAMVMRGRPVTVFDPLRAVLLDSPTDYSFPSGHAAGSFCFALFVTRVLCDRRARHAHLLSALAILFAACVAVSRVVLGFHFPLDVFAGELLGGTLGAIGGARFRKAERM